MKQIIAIIRDEKVEPSREALTRMNITWVMILPVMGRGLQKGAVPETREEGSLGRNAGLHLRRLPVTTEDPETPGTQRSRGKQTGAGFLPKHMLIIMVPDEDVTVVVQSLLAVNRSGRHGDGKIFICPIGRALGIESETLCSNPPG